MLPLAETCLLHQHTPIHAGGERGHCRAQCHFWSCHAFYLLTAGGVLGLYWQIQGLHILHQSISKEMKMSVVLCKPTLLSVSRTTSLLLTHQVPASHTHPGAEYPPFSSPNLPPTLFIRLSHDPISILTEGLVSQEPHTSQMRNQCRNSVTM